MIWLPLLLLPLCSLQTSYAWARNPSRTARSPTRHLRVTRRYTLTLEPVWHAWPTNTTTVEKQLNSSFSGLAVSVDTLGSNPNRARKRWRRRTAGVSIIHLTTNNPFCDIDIKHG
ncbi:hypothetical protein C8F01DRAFT_1093722 [Mycena amicta]|nr:hypothetical protein C8F01DRAFT_1093722 [Mycena amicta]